MEAGTAPATSCILRIFKGIRMQMKVEESLGCKMIIKYHSLFFCGEKIQTQILTTHISVHQGNKYAPCFKCIVTISM